MQYGFKTPLVVQELDETSNSGRGLWKLVEPLVYHSALTNEVYTVPAGFKTDFASVPRLPVLWLALGDTAREAGTLHDWLYTAPHPTDRATADALLREAAISTGWGAIRAQALCIGVRTFGAAFWD
jgi:hypothetical protein